MNFKDNKSFLTNQFKQILEMEKKGESPTPQFKMNFYNIVYKACDHKGGRDMYDLHSSFIMYCIKEYINILNNKSNIDFIILFNKQIDRIKYLLKLLNTLFIYLERFYIKSMGILNLNEKSFNLYINEFFILWL